MSSEIILSLKTHNRFDTLKESLESLRKTNFPNNTKLLICDDASDDVRTINLINNYMLNIPIEVIRNDKNIGCDPNGIKSMQEGFSRTDKDFILILDDDAYYHPEWLNKILELNNKYPNTGAISCFNTEKHVILQQREDHTLKKYVSGFTILLRKCIFERLGAHEWDWKITSVSEALGREIICTKESYVQSIGKHGFHSKKGTGKIGDWVNNFAGDEKEAMKIREQLADKKRY
jgi:hypothetical protein